MVIIIVLGIIIYTVNQDVPEGGSTGARKHRCDVASPRSCKLKCALLNVTPTLSFPSDLDDLTLEELEELDDDDDDELDSYDTPPGVGAQPGGNPAAYSGEPRPFRYCHLPPLNLLGLSSGASSAVRVY